GDKDDVRHHGVGDERQHEEDFKIAHDSLSTARRNSEMPSNTLMARSASVRCASRYFDHWNVSGFSLALTFRSKSLYWLIASMSLLKSQSDISWTVILLVICSVL